MRGRWPAPRPGTRARAPLLAGLRARLAAGRDARARPSVPLERAGEVVEHLGQAAVLLDVAREARDARVRAPAARLVLRRQVLQRLPRRGCSYLFVYVEGHCLSAIGARRAVCQVTRGPPGGAGLLAARHRRPQGHLQVARLLRPDASPQERAGYPVPYTLPLTKLRQGWRALLVGRAECAALLRLG